MLNERDKRWKRNILHISQKLKINFHINFIQDTQGQAETAYLATEIIKSSNNSDQIKDVPLAFHNGDTILMNRDLNYINQTIYNSFDGVIDTFRSDSDNFSYISIDSQSTVEKIVEKKVISNRATTGFYIFSNYMKYRFLYKKINKIKKELYISDVYTEAINRGQKIFNIHYNDPSDTIVIGTPQEYEEWLQK